MAEVPIMFNGVLFDKQWRTSRPVVLMGVAYNPTLEIGGGPIYPPEGPGGPVGHPEHPIYYPPGIWGPTDPRPTPPIANVPGLPPMPDQPPPNQNEPKPPPPGGGWGWHPEYGWGYFPMGGGKPQPPGSGGSPGEPGTPGEPGAPGRRGR